MVRRIPFVSNLLFLVAVATAMAFSAGAQNCGLRLEVTAINKHLIGTLRTATGSLCTNASIAWYNSKNNELLQEGPILDYDLSSYGDFSVKAVYLMEQDGIACAGELKQNLMIVEPACEQLFPTTSSSYSSNINAPVCGCNGVNYENEFNARSSGVSGWWAGNCSSQPGCGTADLDVEVYAGNPTDGYWVRFTNLSAGNFTHVQLDFGDNCQIYQASQWVTKNHHYPKGGIYMANLTAWNVNQPGCVTSFTKTFATDALSLTNANIPESIDYVLPGDANGDGKANAYDILQLSRGYGKSGSPRPEASSDWTLQYAPNWLQTTVNGINYKHIDTNGDGQINEFDTEPLEMHYQSVELNQPVFKEGVPQIYTRFSEDTLFLDPAHPENLEINADIMVGTASQPVSDLYGLAFALRYPEMVAHDPVMYYDPSLFGSSNYVLSLGQDNHNLLQYDMGFARKNGAGVSGYGRMAKLTFRADFIIIIDIIDRAESDVVAFTIPVDGIQAIDSSGNTISLSTTSTPDTLWIKSLGDISKTKDLLLQKAVQLYPNPATDQITINTGNLNFSNINVINSLGQTVREVVPTSGQNLIKIDVNQWNPGLYIARITTEKGVIEKQFIVK